MADEYRDRADVGIYPIGAVVGMDFVCLFEGLVESLNVDRWAMVRVKFVASHFHRYACKPCDYYNRRSRVVRDGESRSGELTVERLDVVQFSKYAVSEWYRLVEKNRDSPSAQVQVSAVEMKEVSLLVKHGVTRASILMPHSDGLYRFGNFQLGGSLRKLDVATALATSCPHYNRI